MDYIEQYEIILPVLHRTVLNHITSHRIASHRIASHRIASHRIASHRITWAWHHVTSHHMGMASHRMASHDSSKMRYIVSYLIVLYYWIVVKIPERGICKHSTSLPPTHPLQILFPTSR